MLSQAGNAPSMKADPLHNCEILFFVYNKVAERALQTAHPFKEDMPVISPGISEKKYCTLCASSDWTVSRNRQGREWIRNMKVWLVLLLSLFVLAGSASAESFLVISDTHMRADTDAFDAAYAAILENAKSGDVCVLLGDSTDNGRMEEHVLVLERLHRLQEETDVQVFAIPGNHDYNAHFTKDTFREMYGAYGSQQAFSRDKASASCAVMTQAGTCILLLDTNRLDVQDQVLPDGGIHEETLAWIRQVLQELPENVPVIACGHHPILPSERDARTPGARKLSELLSAYGVTLYLCGHDHGFATVVFSGLRQITVGQPQAFPGFAGRIRRDDSGFHWTEEALYDLSSDTFRKMQSDTEALSISMAEGTLAPTQYAGDEGAINWFSRAFMLHVSGQLTPEYAKALLKDDNCRKWREVEVRTVVKKWILSPLEDCPEDMHVLEIPLRRFEK